MALGLTKISGTLISNGSVSASSTTWGTALNGGSGERFGHLVFQFKFTMSGSATQGAIVHLRKSTDDGTTDTDLGTQLFSVDYYNGTRIVEFEAYGGDYIEVGLQNLDTGQSITAVYLTYEGIKITGMS